MFFYNVSFNFETLALDVEVCYTGIGSNIVRIYGFIFEKKLHLHLNYQCKMAYILFEIKFYYTLVNLGLRCCPPNQFFVQLFGHGICPIYKFSSIYHHHGNNIYVIKVIDSIPFINNLNDCRKMKIIRWFHYTNTPLFYVYVNSRQSNVLKHSFNSLLFNFFFLFPTNVWYFKHNNDDIFIHNNYLLPYPNIKLCPCSQLSKYWKILPTNYDMVFSTQFWIDLPTQSWMPISSLFLPFSPK